MLPKTSFKGHRHPARVRDASLVLGPNGVRGYLFSVPFGNSASRSQELAVGTSFSKAIGHFGLAETHISLSLGKDGISKTHLSSFAYGRSARV